MSRRHSAEKREIIPDAKYGDVIVAKFMNTIMYEGKKSVAEHILYGVLEKIQKFSKGTNALEIFKNAIENVRPHPQLRHL